MKTSKVWLFAERHVLLHLHIDLFDHIALTVLILLITHGIKANSSFYVIRRKQKQNLCTRIHYTYLDQISASYRHKNASRSRQLLAPIQVAINNIWHLVQKENGYFFFVFNWFYVFITNYTNLQLETLKKTLIFWKVITF